MRPYKDFKKQYNLKTHRKLLSTYIGVSCGLLAIILLVFPIVFSHAQTAQEVKNKISAKNADISKLEEEIRAYQKELENLGKQKDSLSVSIKQLDLTKKKLNADIAVSQNKIDKTNLQIQNLTSDIGNKEISIETSLDSIKLEIRKMNELANTSVLETILSNDSFTVIWNDIDNIISVREKMRESIAKLRETKTILEDTRVETIEAKNELSRLKTQLSDQQKIVTQNTNEKNKLLSQTKNSEVNYQKLVVEQLEKKIAFEKELQDYEAELQFILDPSKLPNAGVLSWPLDSIFVTSPFGPRWGSFHYGVDFRASVGTPVKSMADGVVKGVGDTDICCPGASAGKWILIEYNNGLSSTFMHLSFIKVQNGQRVGRGEVVGYSGNTGSSTGPHLHVSLYASFKDALGNPGVEVGSFESKSYPGRILTQPVSAVSARLEPMYYLPSLSR